MTKQRVTILFLVSCSRLQRLPCASLSSKPFIGALLSAAVIAIVFFPVQAKMVKWVHSPSLAALLSTILVVLVVVVPAVGIGVAITEEVTDLYHELGERSSDFGGWSPWHVSELLRRPLDWVGKYVDLSPDRPSRVAPHAGSSRWDRSFILR